MQSKNSLKICVDNRIINAISNIDNNEFGLDEYDFWLYLILRTMEKECSDYSSKIFYDNWINGRIFEVELLNVTDFMKTRLGMDRRKENTDRINLSIKKLRNAKLIQFCDTEYKVERQDVDFFNLGTDRILFFCPSERFTMIPTIDLVKLCKYCKENNKHSSYKYYSVLLYAMICFHRINDNLDGCYLKADEVGYFTSQKWKWTSIDDILESIGVCHISFTHRTEEGYFQRQYFGFNGMDKLKQFIYKYASEKMNDTNVKAFGFVDELFEDRRQEKPNPRKPKKVKEEVVIEDELDLDWGDWLNETSVTAAAEPVKEKSDEEFIKQQEERFEREQAERIKNTNTQRMRANAMVAQTMRAMESGIL